MATRRIDEKERRRDELNIEDDDELLMMMLGNYLNIDKDDDKLTMMNLGFVAWRLKKVREEEKQGYYCWCINTNAIGVNVQVYTTSNKVMSI